MHLQGNALLLEPMPLQRLATRIRLSLGLEVQNKFLPVTAQPQISQPVYQVTAQRASFTLPLPYELHLALVESSAFLDNFRGELRREKRAETRNQSELCSSVHMQLSIFGASRALIRELFEAQTLYFQWFSSPT